MNTRRFRDDGRSLATFGDSFLVVCPRCGRCAHVLPRDPARHGYRDPWRVSCLHCGYVQTWPPERTARPRPQWGKEHRRGTERRQISTGTFVPSAHSAARRAADGPTDWYFRLPLYLQTECAGRRLWAYNVEHLSALEAFVAAPLREASPTHPWSLVSRLPRWMVLAEHREAVLKGIKRLRAKLLA